MPNQEAKILMIVCNYFNPDNRVFRAANTLQEAGFKVTVLSYFKRGLSEEENLGFGFNLKRIKIKELPFPSKQFRNFINHILWRQKVKSIAKELQPEYIHCHDYNTLFLGIFCKRKFNSRVFYDNHEYFQDLKYLHRYPLVFRRWIATFERKALRNFVDELIVVSPGISTAYAKIFMRPIFIVRNIPDPDTFQMIDVSISATVIDFLKQQKLLNRKLFLYLGTNTQRGRGLDFSFNLISSLPKNYGLVVLGAKDDSELTYLKKRALYAGIEERFGAFLSVPIPILSKYSSYFYMGLSLIEPIYFSYLHSLPNKLFEYFSMGLPVVSSEIPDQSELVSGNNLGVIIPFEIASAIEIILKAESLTFNPKIRTLFNWEAEKRILLSVYKVVQ
jgi:glycosyltransferase involved in cell wall biosynthesis